MSFLKPDVPEVTPPPAAPSTPTQASFVSRGSRTKRGPVGNLPLVNPAVIGRSSTTSRPSLLGG